MNSKSWILGGLMLALAGCSEAGGGAENSAGASSGGATTGGATTGGATAGGATAGGGSAGSNSGGSSNPNVCSPGKTTRAAFAYPGLIQNCGFEGKGELAGQDGFYRSIKLPEPIGPGDVFAFSVGLDSLGQGTMDLWGGTGECGEAHEHFATVQIPQGGEKGGFRCMTARPQLGSYPYLIWVMHTAGGHGDVTMCPDVVCPGE